MFDREKEGFMHPPNSIIAFTNVERCDIFRAALGEGIDMRTNPFESVPLDLTLENLHAGGGTLAVLDERHFMEVEHLREGLKRYLNKRRNKGRLMRLIIVCPERMPGDDLLAYLTGYLGIHDIVYGKQGAEAVAELSRLLNEPNERVDILDLLPRREREETVETVAAEGIEGLAGGSFPVSYEVMQNGFKIQVQFSVQPMGSC